MNWGKKIEYKNSKEYNINPPPPPIELLYLNKLS